MKEDSNSQVIEALASYDSAMTAAFQVLIHCLQSNGALGIGQYQEELARYLAITKDKSGPVKTAILEELRESLLP